MCGRYLLYTSVDVRARTFGIDARPDVRAATPIAPIAVPPEPASRS
ncbi:MAG: hypothetical protein AAFX81_17955 [Pseudomonadota bacterium]